VGDLWRTMSHSPDFLRGIWQAVHFYHSSDGSLSHAQRLMIGIYTASLNRCHF
jgi:hypothetical protein